MSSRHDKSVVVVGGGYGGIAVARELDGDHDVVLVDAKDRFVHTVAALRGLVDPGWSEALFLPYDRLLDRGRVVRDRATGVDLDGDLDGDGVVVTLASGARLRAGYAVLATGSAYPFPAKIADDTTADGRARLDHARAALARSASVLLLGAGPAGLELAGEIRAAHQNTAVTVLGESPVILPGPLPDEFRDEVRRQLDLLGIELVLGTRLDGEPPTKPGEHGTFAAATRDGRRVKADLWYRCHGVVPLTGYLRGTLARARRGDGFLDVTDELLLPGQRRVFAIGDVTAVPEPKMAKAAELHAGVVAANIATLTGGGTDLVAYRPPPAGISLPLGPHHGASYSVSTGVLGAERTVALKGSHLRLDLYRGRLGLA